MSRFYETRKLRATKFRTICQVRYNPELDVIVQGREDLSLALIWREERVQFEIRVQGGVNLQSAYVSERWLVKQTWSESQIRGGFRLKSPPNLQRSRDFVGRASGRSSLRNFFEQAVLITLSDLRESIGLNFLDP